MGKRRGCSADDDLAAAWEQGSATGEHGDERADRERPVALSAGLTITAAVRLRKKQGTTGTIAPMARRANDVVAATMGDPPSLSGSISSSSRANVSSAVE